jgi:urea transporter
MDTFMEQQDQLSKGVEVICGIAMALTDDASSIMSSICLFIGKSQSILTIRAVSTVCVFTGLLIQMKLGYVHAIKNDETRFLNSFEHVKIELAGQ